MSATFARKNENNIVIATGITTQVNPPLNADLSGAPSEFYGAFNIDGEFNTITADDPGPGAGLNIAGYIAAHLNNIIDGNLNTSTALGTTDETRMRVTVGFNQAPPSGVPEPSSAWPASFPDAACKCATFININKR